MATCVQNRQASCSTDIFRNPFPIEAQPRLVLKHWWSCTVNSCESPISMEWRSTNVRTGVAVCTALLLWMAATKLAGPVAGNEVILQRSKDFQAADTGAQFRVEVTDTYVMGARGMLRGGSFEQNWQKSKYLTDTVVKEAIKPRVKPASEDITKEWSGVELGQGKVNGKNSATLQVETAEEDVHKVLLELIASHHLWE